MSSHTSYTFPKWYSKTTLFRMLRSVANPEVNEQSEFSDSFEAQGDEGYSPIILGYLYQGRAGRFEALLDTLNLTYERRTAADLDTGDEEEMEFIINGESLGNWLGEVDDFELTAQQVLDLANGNHATRDLITQAEEAITLKAKLEAALEDDVVPEDFSLQSLSLLLEDAGNTPEAKVLMKLLREAKVLTNLLNDSERNIKLEEPPTYVIHGVSQVPVMKPKPKPKP